MDRRASRRHLLLSTATLVGALAGYAGRGYAQMVCVQQGVTSTYNCAATSVDLQDIRINNADVNVVDSTFSVITTDNRAISITGDGVTTGLGALSFYDPHMSTQLDANDTALYISSRGNDGGINGSITVDTNGTLTGGVFGIDANNDGSGAVSITTYGDVTGGSSGIRAFNDGAALTVTANGEVAGTIDHGINAQNGTSGTPAGTNFMVTTGASSYVTGGRYGIYARNFGSGALMVNVDGDVISTEAGMGPTGGITARNGTNAVSAGTHVSVVTGQDTAVTGGDLGIDARNFGTGALTVEAMGDVDGNATGIDARNYGTGALTIEAMGDVEGGDEEGIYARNGDDADLSITTGASANGVTGGNFGIDARNDGSGNLEVNAMGDVSGGNYGIRAQNFGAGALEITANGDVTGSARFGIFARSDGGQINITVAQGGTVTSNSVVGTDSAIQIHPNSTGATNVTVAGTVNAPNSGFAVRFDQTAGKDDRLEIRPTADINGIALAGGGTDTLAFGGAGEATFDVSSIGATQQFQSFELFAKQGASHWTLDGTNNGIDNFAVSGGLLSVNGALPNATFTVNGGALGGTGTVGPLTVMQGGVFAPGNSIGTMTVNGNFTLGAGAVYEVEVNAQGQSDKVIVNGTVNLTGSVLRVLAQSGNYKLETDYLIIENDGTDAVVGEFAQVTTNFAFLTPFVNYAAGTGNDVVLTLLNTTSDFCSVATSANQCNVARALDQFPTDNPLFLALLFQTADGARQAFDALSGEIHATVAGTLADDSRYVREAVLGRLMQASHTGGTTQGAALAYAGPQIASIDANAMALGYGSKSVGEAMPAYEPAPLAFWTRAYGAWGDFDGDGNAATADRDLGGFVSGIDADIGNGWRAGLATGASFSDVSVGDRYSAADVESYTLGGYVGGMAGSFALRGGGMWAWNDIDTSRAVVFPGFFERQKANYDADTGQLFGEIAYPTQMGGIALEPFAGLALVSIDGDTFRERGGALASLRGSGTDQDVGYSTLGLRAATTMYWGSMLVTPHVSAAWQHAFDDVTPGAALAFASTGTGFGIEGVPLAEDSVLIGAGLDFALGESTTAGVSYTGQFGDGVSDNGVKGRFTWLF